MMRLLPPTQHLLVSVPLLFSPACGGGDGHDHDHGPNGHTHGDEDVAEDEHDHGEEVDLGSAKVGDFTCELAQGHGPLMAGEESHLVVKIQGGDGGQSIVRAWLGGEDRTQHLVGKADYAQSHDDYDLHAPAPDPLTDDVRWWIEIETPDGSKHVGSIAPYRE